MSNRRRELANMFLDPHPGNIGLVVPMLQQIEQDRIHEVFSSPEVVPVVPRDPSFPIDTVPPYIIEPASIVDLLRQVKLLKDLTVNIKIFDFGRGKSIYRNIGAIF
jgi:hypothetical protein